MTIDFRLFGERAARSTPAPCRRAYRLQGADRPAGTGQRRVVPRAQGRHSRRQHDDGEVSGTHGGLERHPADGRRHDPHGVGRSDARPYSRRAHGLLGGALAFFGLHPKTRRRFVVQSIEGGGWGGRPFEDGESGDRLGMPGRRAQRPVEGIELKTPVLVESRALRPDSGGAGTYRGGLGIDMMEQPGRGPLVSSEQGVPCSPWGIRGRPAGEWVKPTSRLPATAIFKWITVNIPVPSTPRRSYATAAAAAGAIRWTGTPRSSPRMPRRG